MTLTPTTEARPAPEPPAPERSSLPLFARADFQLIAGEALRPGGLSLTRRALDSAGLPANSRVLDIGCGRGATAGFLSMRRHQVLALDTNPAYAAEAARKGPGITALLGRAEALPLGAHCVDAAFCECVLSLSQRPHAVLAEAARVLRPGGLLVLSDLYLRSLSKPPHAASGCHNTPQAGAQTSRTGSCAEGARSRPELEALISGAGFLAAAFEDHSRLLAELAGRLIFAGFPATGLCACAAGPKPGYFLCLARTPNN